MIPADRVFGVDADASREQILDFARRYGVAQVAVRRPRQPLEWFAYVNVAEVAIENRTVEALLHPLPVIPITARKLEALQVLRATAAIMGVVRDQEQLFRPVKTVVSGPAGVAAAAH
jgi:CBS domain containing-hemolysin-like protein